MILGWYVVFGSLCFSVLCMFVLITKYDSILASGEVKYCIAGIIMFLSWAAFMVYIIIQEDFYVCVDLNANQVIVSKKWLKKEYYDLSKLCSITINNFGGPLWIIVTITGTDYRRRLDEWCSGTRSQMSIVETSKMRQHRYQKFADKVNAIIKERYPNNKPINYDESDE